MLLTKEIAEATYQISTGNSSASSVGVNANGYFFLITARHLFTDEETIQIDVSKNLTKPKCSKVNVRITNTTSPFPSFFTDVYYNDYYDVAVVDVPRTEADNLKEKGADFLSLNYLSDADISIGTDVLLVGFPFIWKSNDIGIKNPNKHSDFYVPLIKSGSFCSFQPENGAYELIDAHNNKGFSGGPVVWSKNNQSYILGTVCGFYWDKFGQEVNENSNSGFAQICAIGHAKALIQHCLYLYSKRGANDENPS